jgi:hypothetical protein
MKWKDPQIAWPLNRPKKSNFPSLGRSSLKLGRLRDSWIDIAFQTCGSFNWGLSSVDRGIQDIFYALNVGQSLVKTLLNLMFNRSSLLLLHKIPRNPNSVDWASTETSTKLLKIAFTFWLTWSFDLVNIGIHKSIDRYVLCVTFIIIIIIDFKAQSAGIEMY